VLALFNIFSTSKNEVARVFIFCRNLTYTPEKTSCGIVSVECHVLLSFHSIINVFETICGAKGEIIRAKVGARSHRGGVIAHSNFCVRISA
jgi:hypothetical protein